MFSKVYIYQVICSGKYKRSYHVNDISAYDCSNKSISYKFWS